MNVHKHRSINGWKHVVGKYVWEKGEHIIKISPTDSRKPRGSKTVWLVENKRLGGKAVRIGYSMTYKDAVKIVVPYLKRW